MMGHLDIAFYAVMGLLALSVVLLLASFFKRMPPCPHRNRIIIVEDTLVTCERVVVKCLDCGKRLKETTET